MPRESIPQSAHWDRYDPGDFYDELISILPVDNYPTQLFEMLSSISPRSRRKPQIVVLTPGIYNSAYFEHFFLAREMGAELVEGGDLFVDEDDRLYMRTIDGPEPVDVVYRRVDDLFLDPEVFKKGSMLGVPGISAPGGRVTWVWPTRRAPGSPTTRWCMPSFRR